MAAWVSPWASTTARAGARPLTPEEKKVVGQRLARVGNARDELTIEEGDTLFVVHRVRLPAGKLTGQASDYVPIVDGVVGPRGISVDERVDQVTVRPSRRGGVDVSFRYAVSVAPGTRRGGRIQLKLKLIERKGIGDLKLQVAMGHLIKVRRPKPSAVDVTADFHGYRIYKKLAAERIQELAAQRIAGLQLKAGDPLPPLNTLSPAQVEQVFEFDRWRRRLWIAYRHLVTASKVGDRSVSSLAQRYLSQLDEPDASLAGLPDVPLVPGAAPIVGQAAVETLAPTAEGPAAPPPTPPSPSPPPSGGSGGGTGDVVVLQPLGEGGDSGRPPASPPPRRPTEDLSEPPPAAPIRAPDRDDPTAAVEAIGGRRETTAPESNTERLPPHPRFLSLEDPNISYGGSVRAIYAEVVTSAKARVPALFVGAQAGLTDDLGVELSVPIALVDLDVAEARNVVKVGNPLLTAKYRLRLPEVMERRPALTLGARWAIPVSPLSGVPPTSYDAEDFSRPAYFADPWAFLLERNGFGLVTATSWELGILHLGGQVSFDYFIPVDGATGANLPILGFGAGAGVHPFGPVIGAYAELRGTSVLVGPGRTELFAYLGARAEIAWLEPALWVALPIGSVGAVGSLQFGAELRIAYDLDTVIVRGAGRRSLQFDEGPL